MSNLIGVVPNGRRREPTDRHTGSVRLKRMIMGSLLSMYSTLLRDDSCGRAVLVVQMPAALVLQAPSVAAEMERACKYLRPR